MTKTRWLVVGCCLLMLTTAASAGLFKNSVDFADLSELSPAALETLKDTEFEVFLAQVQLNAAKAAERRASGAVKAVTRNVEAENLDMKAAKAEMKAAKAQGDDERMTVAGARMTGAEEDLATVKALRKWKAQERDARQAEVAMAKSALDLAEARRDQARVRLLHDEQSSAAQKYDLGEFDRNVSARQKEYDNASRKASEKLVKLDKLKEEWTRLAENVDFLEDD